MLSVRSVANTNVNKAVMISDQAEKERPSNVPFSIEEGGGALVCSNFSGANVSVFGTFLWRGKYNSYMHIFFNTREVPTMGANALQ